MSSVIIAAVDGAAVGAQGLTGLLVGDGEPRVSPLALPGGLNVLTMHRLLLELYESAPGATRVLAVEQPFIPQDRRKLGATLQVQRAAAWWEAAGVFAGAVHVFDPKPQTWRPIIAEDRKLRGLPPVRTGGWKAAAEEYAAEVVGGELPSHHVAESVCIGVWALREWLALPSREQLEELWEVGL